MRILFTILFFGCSLVLQAQRLPVKPNKTDSQNHRQGEWVIYFTGTWQPTSDTSQTVFYRLIEYLDDKPINNVRDYYRNGSLQFEGRLSQDRPEEINEGINTWYYSTGEVRIRGTYLHGEPQGDERVLLRDGKPADENWMEFIQRGMRLSDEKKYKESAAEFERAVQHVEAFSSRESEGYAYCADWLGMEYYLAGEPTKATYYDEEFVTVRRWIHPQPDTLMLTKLSDLLSAYKLRKDWVTAKKYGREFLALNAQYFQTNHPQYPTVLQTLGTVCDALHEYDDALDYLSNAEKLFKDDWSQYEYPIISNMVSLAGVYLSMGDMVKGEQFLTRKIQVLKTRYGTQSEYYQVALGLLARLHAGIGQYRLAEREWTEELRLAEAANGNQSVEYASILGSLAELYIVLGDLAKADKLAQQAKLIYESHPNFDEAYIEFLAKLSVLYELLGNKQSWLEVIQKRNDITWQHFGSGSVDYARALLQEAQYFFNEKNFDKAIGIAQEAIGIMRKFGLQKLASHEKNDLARLYITVASANLLLYYKKFEPSRLNLTQQNAEQAIELYGQINGKEYPLAANDAYISLAMVASARNDESKANALIETVLTKVKSQLGANNFQLIDLLFLIAKRSELNQDFEKSFNYYKRAIDQLSRFIQDVFPYLSEGEREQLYAKNKSVLQSFYGFAAQYHEKLPGLADEWFNVTMRQKGIILQSVASMRQAIDAFGDQNAKQAFDKWQVLRQEYVRLVQQPQADELQIKKVNETLTQQEKTLFASVVLKNFSLSPFTYKDLKQKLNTTDAAVEIVYTILDTESGYDTAYYALVAKAGLEHPKVVRLQSVSVIEGRALRYYKNTIAKQLEDNNSYSIFWKPLEGVLNSISRVWLSLDGAYHTINPSTLYNPTTGKFLYEQIQIINVPSTVTLANSQSNDVLSKVALFAHPTYGEAVVQNVSNNTRSFDLESFSDLPGTEKELEDIASLLSKSNIGFVDFEGAKATEEALKKLEIPQVLHIATHGYFLPPQLALQNQNVLLRSGLLMAGCQKKPHLTDFNRDDGILTAYEVAGLSLHQTSLVVLSACETGLGDVKNGEGVYGLQRAFLMAGARRVMMSLWKVDDDATREFMALFYEGWLKLKDIDEAFVYAQQTLRIKFPHPYYWGAFVLTGN